MLEMSPFTSTWFSPLVKLGHFCLVVPNDRRDYYQTIKPSVAISFFCGNTLPFSQILTREFKSKRFYTNVSSAQFLVTTKQV